MTDQTQADAPAEGTAEAQAPSHIFKIRITKARQDLAVDWASLPPEVQMYVVEQGLGKLLNGATSKETAKTTPDETTRGQNAMALANKKLAALKEGQIKRTTKSDGKVSGAVKAEAMRLAKAVIKAAIKANKEKISDYKPSAITEAARLHLESDAGKALVEQAKANIAAAEKLASSSQADLSGLKADAERVAKREAKNAAARAETEAKSAGAPGPVKTPAVKGKMPKVPSKPVPTRPQANA